MLSSRAWFRVAIAGVLGLFYVGSNLRSKTPSFARNTAFGQEVPVERLKWEGLAGNSQWGTVHSRTKIPGGSLVESLYSNSNGIGDGLAFVPDPEHKWDGNSLP
jgi:hypothetical protein